MKFTTTRFIPVLGIALCLAISGTAKATSINFTVDTSGGATGLTPIANSTANTGKYAAGTWLTLSGGVSAVASGITASGSFTAQKASSGSFSTGNPGSLVAFYAGNLLADVDYYNNTIKLTGGSLVDANTYNAHYPEVAGPAVPLSPQIGGGATGAPGSDPADYGVNLKITALFGLVTAANGTGALRNVVVDLRQRALDNPPPVDHENLAGPLANQTFATANNLELGTVGGDLDFNLKGGVLGTTTIPDIFGTTPIDSAQYTLTTGGTATLNTVLVPNGKHIGEAGALANIMITIPIKASQITTITGDTPITATITLTGQMAAYAMNVSVPEPGTIALASLAGLALIPVGIRRFRSRSAKASK